MIRRKKIAIFGFAKEGIAAANFLGKENHISIFDEKSSDQIDKKYFNDLEIKNAQFFLGKNLNLGQKFDYIVRSPGVKIDNLNLKKLLKKGGILTSSTKIFFDLCPCPIIGVTGTKGKGTTSTLTSEMLKTQNRRVFLAGNIGVPALEILSKLTDKSLVVLELSSFQLIDLKKSPHTAVVLMITSEHLDWHKNDTEYLGAKESIVSFQSSDDFSIINRDFSNSLTFSKKTKAKVYFFSTKTKTNGLYLLKDKIISEIGSHEEICSTQEILLPGFHNLQNVLASIAVAKINKISTKNIIKVLRTFKGLVHRLQFVENINDVKFYNDSFSTIPETTIAAINSFINPKILILGGSSKKSDFSALSEKIVNDKTVKALILIGQEKTRILEAIRKTGGFKGEIFQDTKNMRDIVKTANKIAVPEDIVILSPACASFDMFKNYKDRGEQFIKEVKKLKIN